MIIHIRKLVAFSFALAPVLLLAFGICELKAVSFLTISPMTEALQDHTMTLLPNGKVLVAGGFTNNFGINPVSSNTELYDPATGAWTTTNSLDTALGFH